MSINALQTVQCPACDAEVSVDVCFSVNGGRHPHFRAAIIGGTYQRHTCPNCQRSFRLEPDLTYFDAGRAQWIITRPPSEVDGWDEVEAAAAEIFAKAFGPETPPAAQRLGEQLKVRVAFGWPALREKIVCAEAGLDDVVLELCKLAIVRNLDGAPLADGVELRLLGVRDGTMAFVWLDPVTEAVVESLEVPRSLYDDIAAAEDDWAPLKSALQSGPFVDIDRLLVQPVELAA